MKRLLFFFLFFSACSSSESDRADTGSSPSADATGFADATASDVGTDGGQPNSGDAEVESDATIARDAAVIDADLTGTSLENISLEWNAPLQLCEEWLFGGTSQDLEQAVRQKVQVNLQPQARASLNPADLAAATLSDGFVHRSPFSADQFVIDRPVTTLVEWTLSGPPESASLFAELAHDLGAAGTLFETFTVRRLAGDRAPVRYSDQTEAQFSYDPPDTDRFPLVPCGGNANGLETSVTVLTAFRGDESLTLIREQRAQVVVAGSGAVYPSRAEAILSTAPPYSEATLTEGHFSQFYTAGLHNWNEHARIRFDRDLKLNYLVFGPLARGEMPTYPPQMLKELDLVNLNMAATGTVDVTTVALPDGTETRETFDVEVDWIRVDDTELSRELTGCPNPAVIAVWGVTSEAVHLFQLGFCSTNAPITDLELFVPVYFKPNPRLVGQRFRTITPATVAGFPGVEIDLGTHIVQLAEPGVFRAIILDSNRAELEENNLYETELFETNFAPGLRQTLSARSGDGTVSAALERQWVAQGVGNSSIYAPISFELTFAGETHRVIAWDKLDYWNTHHNWNDTLESEDSELRMSWTALEFGRVYQVRAERIADGVVVLPATEIR